MVRDYQINDMERQLESKLETALNKDDDEPLVYKRHIDAIAENMIRIEHLEFVVARLLKRVRELESEIDDLKEE